MNLLTGILGSGNLGGRMSTTINKVSATNTSSSSLSITGASTNQLYILLHSAYSSSTNLTAPSTPSGFSSITVSGNNKIVSRISATVLTSNIASFSLPSVSNAQSQIAIGFIYTPTTGVPKQTNTVESGFAYYANGADPVEQIVNSVDIQDILVSFVGSSSPSFNTSSNWTPTQSETLIVNGLTVIVQTAVAEQTTNASFDVNTSTGDSLVNLFKSTVLF
jgi:hypothetical protein